MAPGSGRSCAWHTTALPDVTVIETTLAGGTVAQDIICAGLSEHRAGAVDSALESTKGWLGVQPGPRIFLPSRRTGIPGEKNDCERTRKQWTAIPADAARSPDTNDDRNLSQQTTHTRPSWWGSAPPAPPEIYRIRANPGDQTETGHR